VQELFQKSFTSVEKKLLLLLFWWLVLQPSYWCKCWFKNVYHRIFWKDVVSFDYKDQ